MSPEQATGKPVDARTDIFALGAVLYEMATGRRAFPGASHAEALGAVLTREPPLPSILRPKIPQWFDQLVAVCLAKDPSERWDSAHDLAIRLRTPPTERELHGGARGGRRGQWLAAVLLLGLLLGAGIVALLRSRPPPSRAEPPVRLAQAPPPGTRIFHNREVTSIAVSPDGRRIAFITYRSGVPSVWLRPEGRQVWIRDLAAPEPHPVPLTDGATSVFWSSDGESLGFVVPGAMKRVALSGGPPVVICPLERQVGYAASWGPDGRIVFGSIIGDGLFEVPAAGGEPRLLLRPDRAKGEFALHWPVHIPGNRILFLSRKADSASLMLLAPGQAARPVMPLSSRVQLVDPGVLVYVREGTLVAQRFDLDAGEVRGEPWALASHTRSFGSNGSAEFAASPAGTLVWQPTEDVQSLRWLDRTGKGVGGLGESGVWNDVSISPDGGAVLASRARYETGILDVWSFDLTTGGAAPIVARPFTECFALWHPSGTQLAYSATEGGPPHLRRRDLATGEDVELRPRGSFQIAQSFSPDGRALIFTQRMEQGAQRAWEMPFQAGGEPTLLPLGDGDTWNVRHSPDGEYLAYVSSQSGRGELSIARHGRLGPPVPVSSSGALLARWSATAGEILYMAPDGKVWAVPVSTRPTLRVSRPVLLFQLPPDRLWYDFDVTPDGRRFLAVVPEVQADEHALEILLHPPTASPGG
jgi:Tol biopolymer transport system component